MKNMISAVAYLLFCGSVFADEPKKIEIEVKKPIVDVKVVPRVGTPLPVVRPLPGNNYWRHPNYGWGYWYYPAPVAAPAPNFYLDQYGRVVPSGFVYDGYGRLVPLQTYPYSNYGRWGWWRR